MDKFTSETFAMKKIRKEIIKDIPANIKQVENELNIMYSLDHPNIIKLVTHFEDADYIYLIQEFAPGKSLYDKLKTSGRINDLQCANYVK